MDTNIPPVVVSESTLYHFHRTAELCSDEVCFLVSVRGRATIGSTGRTDVLNDGELLLLSSPSFFTVTPSGSAVLLLVEINPLFFLEAFGVTPERFLVNPKDGIDEAPLRAAIVRLALLHTVDREENSLLIRSAIYTLFHTLKANYPVAPRALPEALKEKQRARLSLLLDLLEARFSEPLTLQIVSDTLSLTPQYLAGFLKEHLGVTFLSLLNEIRLSAARRALLHTADPIDRVATLTGFSTEEVFRKKFAETYGGTPEETREAARTEREAHRARAQQIREVAMIRDYLNNFLPGSYLQTPAIERVRSLSYDCDVEEQIPLFSTWDQLINLGAAVTLEDPTFRLHLKTLQDGLHFRFGRITGILHLVEIYTEDDKHYSFGFPRVFSLLDYILSLGMRPFLDLDNKSADIYTESGLTLASGSIGFDAIGEQLIPSLLRECVNRYGFDEVSLWRVELWQRYYDVHLKEFEDSGHYADRFVFLYQTVKSLIPKLLVGGPGFNTFLPEAYFRETLDALNERGVRPDFLSCYLYPYVRDRNWREREEPSFVLASNPNEFPNRLKKLHEIMEETGFGGTPLFVTEFSTNIIYKNHINDSLYLAVFLLKNLLDCRSYVSGMGYWLATDATLDYAGNDAFLFGGNGLLSRSGLRKPGFFAYAWLNHLDHRLIKEGEHFILTAGDQEYKLLLFHYAHFTDSYCANPRAHDQMRYPDGAFVESTPIDLTFTLKNLTPGRYRLTKTLLDQSHGSIFHEWSKLRFVSTLSRFERDQVIAACAAEMTIEELEVDGTLTITERLPRHTVKFLLIRRVL